MGDTYVHKNTGRRPPNARLSYEDVAEIRRRRAVDGTLYKVLAADFKVSLPHIHRICRGEYYKNIPVHSQEPAYYKTSVKGAYGDRGEELVKFASRSAGEQS